MKNIKNRIISAILAIFMLVSALPMTVFASNIAAKTGNAENKNGAGSIQWSDTPEYLEMSDGYIKVKVSVKNGGFHIGTAEGDVIAKSDDNKNLMYNDSDFDTSFTTFRVTRNGKTEDFIFGRSYAHMGLETSAVHIYRSADNAIVAEWQVDNVLFKQTIALMGADSYQHGMAYISYSAVNMGGTPIENIEARVLIDTALGEVDYGYYMLGQEDGSYVSVEKEKTLAGSEYFNYFFAYDNKTNPNVTAYMLNDSNRGEWGTPKKVTFAHWMDLASTVYDYTPSEENPPNFTEVYGDIDKLTADSAFALYYDMGNIGAAEAVSTQGNTISFYYGVFSNYKAGKSDIAVNFTAAGTMFFDEKSSENVYRDMNGDLPGNFSATIKLSNIIDKTFGSVSVAVYHEDAIKLHTGSSFTVSTPENPYYKTVTELKPGETRDVRIDFQLDPTLVTSYRRVRIVIYSASNEEGFTDENLIAEKEMFILCPGDESAEVTFTGMNPESVFMKGKRFAYITGTNFSMIRDTTQYRIILRPLDGGEDIVMDMDKVVVNTEQNTAALVLDMELRPTTYAVILDWYDTSIEDMTSNTLELTVTDIPNPGDPGYVSSGVYGVITIERNGTSYDIVNYDTEEAFRNTETAKEDIMAVFRGDFNVLSTDGKPNFKAEAVTLMPGEVITVNDCIEVKDGRVTITKVYDENGKQTSIDVDIDGKLYTSVANTKIWEGVMALTSFNEGTLYTLPIYSEQGKLSYRKGEEHGEKITLLWPGAASATQTIMGLLLNFRYGEFALMEQGDSEERVIAFGAALDPSILVPTGMVGTDVHYSNLEKTQMEMGVSNYTAAQLRATDTKYRKDQAAWRQKQQGTLNLYMDDILFGAGGFIGFNTEISVGIPSYTDPLPYINGTLALKIIREYWEFGVNGRADMMVFEMEAKLSFKSYNGIPIADEIYFFIGGLQPGVPVDPFGVFWIKGAGGGVSKIYETFFGGTRVPPLMLTISGEFALFSQLSARADISLSARGIEGYLRNVGIAGITIIDRVGGSLYWYPNFSLAFAIRVDILDCIIGEGGIVLKETDDGIYFCGYAKASVRIPDYIWFIGGTEIGSASIGVDTQKIWGSVKIIGIGVGVRYYWGGDVKFDVGETYDVPTPLTYTAMRAPIPVYTDETTGDTLYMAIVNDVRLLSDKSAGLDHTEITTTDFGKTHEFVLNSSSNEDALIGLTFSAENLLMAQDIKNSIKVTAGGSAYSLEWFDSRFSADHELNNGTNAMFKYDAESKLATVSISVTDSTKYDKAINITSDAVTEIQILGIAKATYLESVEMNEAKNEVTVTGSALNRLSRLDVYLEDSNGTPYLLAEISPDEGASFGENSVTVPVALPLNLPTDEYILRASGVVLDENGEEAENPMAESTFSHVNPHQPSAPSSVVLALSGDFTITASVTSGRDDRDGYVTTIYEVTENGNVATVFTNIATAVGGDSAKSLQTDILMGGRFTSTKTVDGEHIETEQGLEAGKNYVVCVQAYKDMEDGSRVLSEAIVSAPITMQLPIEVKPEISIESNTESGLTVNRIEMGETNVLVDTVNKGSFTISIKAEGFGSGQYCINDGEYTDWNGGDITLENKEDGFYILKLKGVSTTGDAFTASYQFSIDTLAPSVLISSHQGGGFFTGNSASVSGHTEAFSKLDVYVEGDLVATEYADGSGNFAIEVPLDESMAYQKVVIYSTDRAGNKSMPFACDLTNSILGDPDIKAVILRNGREVSSLIIGEDPTQLSFAYKLGNRYVTLNEGSTAAGKIVWNTDMIKGSANVSLDGELKGTPGACGIVTASLQGKTAYVELVALNLSEADIKLDIPEEGLLYNGTEHKPNIIIGTGEEIVRDVDYTIDYLDNVNAGKAFAIVSATADGKCVGNYIIDFEIKKRSFYDEAFGFEILEDDGNVSAVLTYGEDTLVAGKDYTVSTQQHASDKAFYIVTVEGTGNYEGLKSVYYTVKGKEHLDFNRDHICDVCGVNLQGSENPGGNGSDSDKTSPLTVVIIVIVSVVALAGAVCVVLVVLTKKGIDVIEIIGKKKNIKNQNFEKTENSEISDENEDDDGTEN